MSLFAMSWAFGTELPPNEKIVLLALADCENGETLRCDPSQKHLAKMASVSERTVRDMLKALEERQLIVREKRGNGERGGRQTDNFRLACRGLPADSAGRVTGKSEGGYRQTAAGTGNRKEPEDFSGPVTEVTTDGAVDNFAAVGSAARDGRATPAATPTNLAAFRGHGVSTPDIFAAVGEYLEPTRLDDEGLHRLAAEILAKASARVVNPTAFVVSALRNRDTRGEWVARAWVIAGDVHLERAGRAAS